MGENHTDVLRRWEDEGATWRVLHLSDAKAIVDLCACTGEPMDRIESDDADLIAFLRERAALDHG
jgi:hypothetical protein